jgi:hypothetical protein
MTTSNRPTLLTNRYKTRETQQEASRMQITKQAVPRQAEQRAKRQRHHASATVDSKTVSSRRAWHRIAATNQSKDLGFSPGARRRTERSATTPSGGDGVHERRCRDPNGQGLTNGMYSPPFAFILFFYIGLILCIYFDSLHWLLHNLLILCICCCTTRTALVVACTQGSWCVYIKNHAIDPSKQVLTMSPCYRWPFPDSVRCHRRSTLAQRLSSFWRHSLLLHGLWTRPREGVF